MIMHLLRCLFFYVAQFNINISAEHIPGMQNSVADSISRFHMQVFQELAPQADLLPTPIPSSLKNLLTVRHQDWLLPRLEGIAVGLIKDSIAPSSQSLRVGSEVVHSFL